jgi:hypothetical protein
MIFTNSKGKKLQIVKPLILGFYWCGSGIYHISYILRHWENFKNIGFGLEIFYRYAQDKITVVLRDEFLSVTLSSDINLSFKVMRQLGELGWDFDGRNQWFFQFPYGGGLWLFYTFKDHLR